MKNIIAIIAGEPNSINSEIIFKSWILKKKYRLKPIVIIGSFDLFVTQMKKLNFKLKVKKIKSNFSINDLKGNAIPVIDVNYKQAKSFQKISSKSNNYIFKCFEIAIKLVKEKKIIGFINCPVMKETLFKNKYQGVTEYLADISKVKGNNVMLLYNKELSVVPITTHIPLSKISLNLSKSIITRKVMIVNNFYKKYFNKSPIFGILGLNPHNHSPKKKSAEKTIISPAITYIRKKGIKVLGPISPDTSFISYKKNKINVIIGMYHDQVLTPFKTLFNYDAINITLGLPFVRITPDHGVAENIVGMKKANPKSLIESIKFFNNIKK